MLSVACWFDFRNHNDDWRPASKVAVGNKQGEKNDDLMKLNKKK